MESDLNERSGRSCILHVAGFNPLLLDLLWAAESFDLRAFTNLKIHQGLPQSFD